MNGKRVNKFAVTLILLMISLYPSYSEDTVTAVIGGETIVFNLPQDVEKLKKYYKTLISVYASSENKNLELTKTVEEYIDITEDLKAKAAEVKVETKLVEVKTTEFIELAFKPRWLMGPIFGYAFQTDNSSKVFTVGGQILYVREKIAFGLGIPISMSRTQSDSFNVIIGATLGVLVPFEKK